MVNVKKIWTANKTAVASWMGLNPSVIGVTLHYRHQQPPKRVVGVRALGFMWIVAVAVDIIIVNDTFSVKGEHTALVLVILRECQHNSIAGR